MIVTEMYRGQGLGNQLWCYVTTRALALDRGFRFGIKSPENFKGLEFMDLDFGDQIFGGKGPEGGPPSELPQGIARYYAERSILHPDGSDIRTWDDALFRIEDDTKLDGLLQDSSYIARRLDDVKRWLAVRPEYECFDYSSDDICVINFRGGGYVLDKKFFLPERYWQDAVAHMRTINPRFRFVVVTDDVKTAKRFFPDFEVNHWNIAKDYVVIKNAHYLILSNSSFAQFPAMTSSRLKYCLAPKYWARHNTSDGYWSLGYNIVDGWNYIDRDGKIFDSSACRQEFAAYIEQNKDKLTIERKYNPQKEYIPPAVPPRKTPSRSIRTLISKAKIKIRWAVKTSISYKLFEPISVRIADWKTRKNWLSLSKIADYRKKIEIYDVFTFFNELDLLEIRLNILDPYVDHFVLVESTKTFSGHTKPLYYAENKERFAKWNSKIIHYVVDDAPDSEDELRVRLHGDKPLDTQERLTIQFALTSHTAGLDTKHWFREFYIKESTRKALKGLKDDDICYVSDLDEIWNPELLVDYSKDDIFKPIQKTYAYFLNNRSSEHWKGWTGTIVTKYKNIRHSCLNHLRTHKMMEGRYSFLRNGGWHFTFQGGYEGAKKKIEESKHFWYDPEKTLPNLWSRIKSNEDFRGRGIKLWKDERGLPRYLIENKERYKKFFK